MKHTLFISILSALIIPSFSFARLSDGKDQLKLSGSKITATLEKGFHFNKEAPAGLYLDGELGAIEPLKKTEKQIVFNAAKAKGKTFTVSFYVCDDAKTVCESHESHLEIKKGKLVKIEDQKEEMVTPGSSPDSTKKPTAEKKEVVLLKDDHGFYDNNFEKILAMAKTENKMILVDFMAPWCPACIRMENETFGETVFQDATEDFIKVSVNADKPENKIFTKQFDIPGYPTLLILSPDGAEMARFIDFKPATTLAQEINEYKKGKLQTVAQLTKKAEAGDAEARVLLARRAFNTLRFDEAVKLLAPLNQKSLLLTISEVGQAEGRYQADKTKNRAAYQVALEKAISEYPQSLEAIVFRNDLAELLKSEGPATAEKIQTVTKQNIAVIDETLKSDAKVKALFAENLAGDFTKFESAKLWSEKYKSAKLMGDETLKKESQKQVSKLVKPELKTEFPGAMMAGLGLLKDVDLKEDTLNGIEKLAKTYPQSDVYQHKAAYALTRAKKFEKALPYAQKVTQMTSGTAFLDMAILAEIYQGLNRKTDALQAADKALNMPEAKLPQNKELASSVEEMKKSLK